MGDISKWKRIAVKEIVRLLKEWGATNVTSRVPKGENSWSLDVIIDFTYQSEKFEVKGIKHLYEYNPDDGEDVFGNWNWSVHYKGRFSGDDSPIAKKLLKYVEGEV